MSRQQTSTPDPALPRVKVTPRSVILVYGQILHELKLLNEMAKALPHSDLIVGQMHGRLQVMRSSIARLHAHVGMLLDLEEAARHV
ncbi:MAG: hypothetical protein FJW34_00160 [Acidobacteria bacterium]|nr:hypothetical protein [Acidobacteriota bacterium]